jgi:hypothetical protein
MYSMAQEGAREERCNGYTWPTVESSRGSGAVFEHGAVICFIGPEIAGGTGGLGEFSGGVCVVFAASDGE